jgi:hypothetical protein
VYGGARALLAAMSAGLVAIGCEGESSFAIPAVDAGAPGDRYAAACASWADALCAHESALQGGVIVQVGWMAVTIGPAFYVFSRKDMLV